MKIENFRNPFTFCLLVARFRNMALEKHKKLRFGKFRSFFHKKYCVYIKILFSSLKLLKFSKRRNGVWDCWRMYLKFKIQIHVF
jgi:hypothetical protein